MFASIYHARVFLCVYINSRKMASGRSAGSSSHDCVEVLSVLVLRAEYLHSYARTHLHSYTLRKREERGIRVKNASISRLLYFTRHCIRIRSTTRATTRAAIFKDTNGRNSRIHCFFIDRFSSSSYAKRNETPRFRVPNGILLVFVKLYYRAFQSLFETSSVFRAYARYKNDDCSCLLSII